MAELSEDSCGWNQAANKENLIKPSPPNNTLSLSLYTSIDAVMHLMVNRHVENVMFKLRKNYERNYIIFFILTFWQYLDRLIKVEKYILN